jgi:PAS domain S-box-containing protein
VAARYRKVYLTTGAVAGWAQPIVDAIDLVRKAIRAAIETGDAVYACYTMYLHVAFLLARNDPLDAVWRESETSLDVARRAKYADVADIIVSQQRFIATMQGWTATFSAFSDAHFDEAAFEAQITGSRSLMTICWYSIVKLKARFLSGNYAEALAASDNAKPVLAASAGLIHQMDYFYYTVLTVSALYESAGTDQQQVWRELLMTHQDQLREWAESCPSTFADKHALVSAEIARLEGRDADALRLYEQAIHLARENGFVQHEGLAHELAAQYCLARTLETAGYAHLRNARNCYARWGAHGKVKQLDERYPRLREERTSVSSVTIVPSDGQLDIETVVKASQALSREIVLPKLIEKLVRIAVEHAGAARGLLILVRDSEPRIEAEATTGQGRIEVVVRQAVVTPSDLPQSALHYVIRTRERVLLDDASADNVYSKDEYVERQRARSVLCLPIVKQAKLIGALYLENNLTPLVFTSDRVAALQLLASQAAISLENAHLYSDLQLQAGLLQRLPVSAWTLDSDGTPDFVNQVWLEYSGQTLDFVRTHPEAWMTAVHPDDREGATTAFWDGVRSGQGFAIETRSLRAQDASYRWHLQQAVVLRDAEGKILKFIGTTTDIDDQKRVEDALRQAQGDLARFNRVTTMGELAATLAHELSQPISGAMTNADVCMRSLERDTPDLDAVRRAVTRLARDTNRASDVIGRIRSQFTRGAQHREVLDVNELSRETVALLRDEAARYNISLRMELAADLPPIVGDRVQLQQVAMNLIVNGIEAMKGVDGIREMVIKSQRAADGQILVSVSDTGIGFPPQLAEQIFEAFFTTKPGGTGMGLRICRSIVESHGGRLWAVGSPLSIFRKEFGQLCRRGHSIGRLSVDVAVDPVVNQALRDSSDV